MNMAASRLHQACKWLINNPGKYSPGISRVFTADGKPCCVIGHVIQQSGLKKRLAPFRGKSFDGAMGARWWSSVDAMRFLLGELTPALEKALEDIEIANDAEMMPHERRLVLVQSLNKLAHLLEVA